MTQILFLIKRFSDWEKLYDKYKKNSNHIDAEFQLWGEMIERYMNRLDLDAATEFMDLEYYDQKEIVYEWIVSGRP